MNNQSVLFLVTIVYQVRMARDLAAVGKVLEYWFCSSNTKNQKIVGIEQIVARPYVPCSLSGEKYALLWSCFDHDNTHKHYFRL